MHARVNLPLFYNISVKMKRPFTNLLQRIWKTLPWKRIFCTVKLPNFSLNN